MTSPTLHLFCGKMAAGKSTLARTLAAAPGHVLIAEDQWTAALFPGQLNTIDDYRVLSARLRAAMAPHVVALLRAGMSVVLDFPGNTPAQRAWMRGIIDEAGVAHVLHLLDVPDDEGKRRLAARNASGTHPFAPTEADYDLFARYFVPPAEAEGFTIRRHGAA